MLSVDQLEMVLCCVRANGSTCYVVLGGRHPGGGGGRGGGEGGTRKLNCMPEGTHNATISHYQELCVRGRVHMSACVRCTCEGVRVLCVCVCVCVCVCGCATSSLGRRLSVTITMWQHTNLIPRPRGRRKHFSLFPCGLGTRPITCHYMCLQSHNPY